MKGRICNCELMETDYEFLEYEESIYLPVSGISFDGDFFKRNEYTDYELSKLIPLNRFSTVSGR